MKHSFSLALIASSTVLGCSSKSSPTATTAAPVVTWITPPSAVMPQSTDPTAPYIPCVAVQVTSGDPACATTTTTSTESLGSAPMLSVKGAPLKGIDVKLGKNPGGGCAARTTDDQGVATFCDLNLGDPRAYTLTATVDGADPVETLPFYIPPTTAAVAPTNVAPLITWQVEPVSTTIMGTLAGVGGACPSVLVASRALATTTDAGAGPVELINGSPLKGVDVKLGKNPGGGSAARATSDDNGIAQFCNVAVDASGAFSFTASLDDGSDDGDAGVDGGGSDAGTTTPALCGDTTDTDSTPVYVSPNSYVLAWTGQPAEVEKDGELSGADCGAIVTVYQTASFVESDAGALPLEVAGAPAPNVVVTFTQAPNAALGTPVTVTTDAFGNATLCGTTFAFTTPTADDSLHAFAIKASVVGAESAYSNPVVVAGD